MKFTDGNWMLRKGVRAFYPTQAYDVEADDDSLTLFAPTRPIRHRGDTLEGPLLTVRFSAPMPNVIRVTLTHFAGAQDQGPHFPLMCQEPAEVTVCANDKVAMLTSDRLSVRVLREKPWEVEFLTDEGIVTRSPARGMGYVELVGEEPYLHEQLALRVGECVYGLGERFTALVKNGQVVDTWNKDGGTGSDQAYKNVPFYLTNKGYGVFVNHPEDVSFEVASEKVSRMQFSVPGQSLDYFLIYGPSPKEILARYTALTGRPALPPAWSFGLWLSTSFTTNYDEPTVTHFLQGMADRDLPLHVFHFDCFWMKEFHWCDFQWDERVFPNPAAMLQRLKQRGLKISLWINPYIAQRSALFAEAKCQGYLLKRPDGSVWQTDQWQPGMGIVDFTNPEARRWFGKQLSALLEMGVDCFKTDFGERIPTDVVYWDGSDPVKMHNFYAYLYNQTVFEVLKAARGEGEAVVFARSATAGCQQFPVHWGGDCYSSFESMAESLRGGLSLSLSGFGFWSHDIGGFEGTPPIEVYKRWIAFGLLSSHSRLHGSSSYRVPWQFDEEAVEVLRHFTKLKCRLMPYLFAQACVASRQGIPMLRAMLLEFPDDPACAYLDRQYLLGDSLLVAPVFSVEGDVEYYVPAGRWADLLTGKVVIGPTWVRETHDFLGLPLLARPNSILAVGTQDDRPDYDYAEDVTFEVYALDDGREVTAIVPTLSGDTALTATVWRQGNRIGANVTGTAKTWRVLLAGMEAVASMQHGRAQQTARGVLLIPDAGAVSLEAQLSSPH